MLLAWILFLSPRRNLDRAIKAHFLLLIIGHSSEERNWASDSLRNHRERHLQVAKETKNM